MKAPKYKILKNKIVVEFDKKSHAETFARMDFFSRLLHSLTINENREWVSGDRLDAEIVGWPKELKWKRVAEKKFESSTTNATQTDLTQYNETLNNAMAGLIDGVENGHGTKMYQFSIRYGENLYEYSFHTKSRTIAALCVLYDLEPHPRNDLEINIPKDLAIKQWPSVTDKSLQRTYGDPSKTADELRNEGWPRFGDKPTMSVYREQVGGQIQQMYLLSTNEQSTHAQVQRTNIPTAWKTALYESQDYTCQICLEKYPAEMLEPDHRIPVIYEADRLTEDNFKEKLMTLCRFCNQQKRETTKRVADDYDWKNSQWAFPEKFEIEVLKNRIQSYIKRSGESFDEVIKKLK